MIAHWIAVVITLFVFLVGSAVLVITGDIIGGWILFLSGVLFFGVMLWEIHSSWNQEEDTH